MIEFIKTLQDVELIAYPYEKYGEYILAVKKKDHGMNLMIANIAKPFAETYNEYKENLPLIDKLGKEIKERFNNYTKLEAENKQLKESVQRLEKKIMTKKRKTHRELMKECFPDPFTKRPEIIIKHGDDYIRGMKYVKCVVDGDICSSLRCPKKQKEIK